MSTTGSGTDDHVVVLFLVFCGTSILSPQRLHQLPFPPTVQDGSCFLLTCTLLVPQVSLVAKNLPASAGDISDVGSVPGSGGPLEKEIATHSRILAWRIPWTEEPGGLQHSGVQRVRQH